MQLGRHGVELINQESLWVLKKQIKGFYMFTKVDCTSIYT